MQLYFFMTNMPIQHTHTVQHKVPVPVPGVWMSWFSPYLAVDYLWCYLWRLKGYRHTQKPHLRSIRPTLTLSTLSALPSLFSGEALASG